MKNMSPILKLYNGILNDYSIRRNTLYHQDIIDLVESKVEKEHIIIDKTIQFDRNLIDVCLQFYPSKEILIPLRNFSKELDINLETLKNI